MMFAVVYLCAKVGQVTGQGLFTIIRQHYPRWILYFLLLTALIGNIIEAAADIGGMAAALNLLVPIPIVWIVMIVGIVLLAVQIWTSYTTIRTIFRWLALTLLAYVGSAILAKPDWRLAIRGTLIPTIHFNRDFLAMLVAVVGTTLSAYLYSWQSNLEVEEQISQGRRRSEDRAGTATEEELRHAARDIAFGMFFSNMIMYFIILSTAATLFKAGRTDISTAAEAAQALRPLAGNAAGLLFAIGVVGVGFLAVPVMTTGAAYDLSQTFGWRYGLHRKPAEAKMFYAAIAVFTLIATCMNFFGVNPIKALVYAGIVQGFSTPFLTLSIMLVTNDRNIMGRWVNRPAINVLGWLTTGAMFAATIGLVLTWIN
jgi:NRAMP (natural resistance-associated macrophage protein)-like metal ion transporter